MWSKAARPRLSEKKSMRLAREHQPNDVESGPSGAFSHVPSGPASGAGAELLVNSIVTSIPNCVNVEPEWPLQTKAHLRFHIGSLSGRIIPCEAES
jgi:hypothetical protein